MTWRRGAGHRPGYICAFTGKVAFRTVTANMIPTGASVETPGGAVWIGCGREIPVFMRNTGAKCELALSAFNVNVAWRDFNRLTRVQNMSRGYGVYDERVLRLLADLRRVTTTRVKVVTDAVREAIGRGAEAGAMMGDGGDWPNHYVRAYEDVDRLDGRGGLRLSRDLQCEECDFQHPSRLPVGPGRDGSQDADRHGHAAVEHGHAAEAAGSSGGRAGEVGVGGEIQDHDGLEDGEGGAVAGAPRNREGGAVRSGLERWRMHVNYHLAAYEHWTDLLIDEGFGLEYLERARRETVHVHQACLSNRGELAIAALDHLCSVPGARTFRPCAARRLRELLQDSVHDSEMRRKFGKSVTVASGSKVRIARGRLMRGGGPNGGMRNST